MSGDDLIVANQPLIEDLRPMLPDEFPGLSIEAVDAAIVRGKEDAAAHDGRGQPDGAFGEVSPPRLARRQVQGMHGVVAGGTIVDQTVGRRERVGIVEIDSLHFPSRFRPSMSRLMERLVGPD